MSQNTDVQGITPRLSDDNLRAIESFEDAFRAAATVVPNGEIVDASQELGTGFILLDRTQKGQLIGRETLFMEWDFNTSDTIYRKDEEGNPTDEFAEFVSVRCVCKAGKNGVEKFILNDGSTGIYQQLRDYTDREGRQGGLYSKKGLRVSQYRNPDGSPAETYYIDTSA